MFYRTSGKVPTYFKIIASQATKRDSLKQNCYCYPSPCHIKAQKPRGLYIPALCTYAGCGELAQAAKKAGEASLLRISRCQAGRDSGPSAAPGVTQGPSPQTGHSGGRQRADPGHLHTQHRATAGLTQAALTFLDILRFLPSLGTVRRSRRNRRKSRARRLRAHPALPPRPTARYAGTRSSRRARGSWEM